ncbi:FAD binding domain-containing protein [Oryzihumus leptocrescens]|uniref:Carbon monoxide dehydrogenase medium subunit n=1 Tax=Oryzihumus leptocrescens TaxID=297536 RepID=A0A542ZGT7_9MICO|nr:xanthine dehydrogenase family protein subunit M [Oryzihumus leptocrescens]TQL59410.1 carbon monoxide dehydrogenase medium subunit [Oryzihumus leptocrescens]
MQVPSPFEYERASSVDEAIALLQRHGEGARLIAGGHSLLPLMKLRLASPEVLVDINALTDLQRIRVEADAVRIGAMVRHAELLASAVVGEHFRLLHEAEQVIADPAVRNRGTVGGSLCQADPAEDLSAAFGALRAEVVIRGAGGERVVPVRELVTGPYETVVAPDEILTEVRVPIRPGTGSSYRKVERRAGDWPIASAGAVVRLEGDTIAEVGIGLAAVGAAHSVVRGAEDAIRGRAADEESIELAAVRASEECSPTTDQRGPADYKRALVAELVRRVLRTAIARSRGEEA